MCIFKLINQPNKYKRLSIQFHKALLIKLGCPNKVQLSRKQHKPALSMVLVCES